VFKEKLRKRGNEMAKKPALGSGVRFKEIEKKAAKSGAENPAAVAAAAGIKKYGKAKMEKMAHAGKMRKEK
jgi:hypothetical protein